MKQLSIGKSLHLVGIALFASMLAAGGTLAGTVNVYCDCTPDTSQGCPFSYCYCTSGQGLGALDTNEYRRNCTNSSAKYPTDPKSWCAGSFPSAMVGALPKNVTCTTPEGIGGADYYYNDCTNWNLSSKHFNVYTYCTNASSYGPSP